MNIAVNLAFRLRSIINLDSMSFLNKAFNRIWKSSNFDFDTCITQLEAETNWNLTTDATTYSSKDIKLNLTLMKNIAHKLHLNGIYAVMGFKILRTGSPLNSTYYQQAPLFL